MQKQLNTEGFGPNAQASVGSGNKEALAAADKVKAALDAIPVDQDALLLAERNDVLDAAIERLGENGENWIDGHLGISRDSGFHIDADYEYDFTEELAELLRTTSHKFCAIGALGASLGPHSRAAINAAVAAVAGVLYRDVDLTPTDGYGFNGGYRVWKFNDTDVGNGGALVLEAFKQAKSQPLRKS